MGVLFTIPKERLLPIVPRPRHRPCSSRPIPVGDGAVHTLLDVYGEINEKMAGGPAGVRVITHSNFMSKGSSGEGGEARRRCDIQQAWASTSIRARGGAVRQRPALRYFQAVLKSIF